MNPVIDETGNRHGQLYVLRRVEVDYAIGGAYWYCICDCKRTVVVRGTDLRRGHTKSCGCSRHSEEVRERTSERRRQEEAERWMTDPTTPSDPWGPPRRLGNTVDRHLDSLESLATVRLTKKGY